MSVRGHVSVFVTLLVTACAGAASTELFDTSGEGQAATEPVGGSADDPSSDDGTSSSDARPDDGDDGDDRNDGDAEAAPPPPPPLPSGCVVETEPNDDDDDANAFTDCIIGELARTDLDYASIVAPPGAKKIALEHSEEGGRVWYRVHIEGIALPAFDEEMPKYIPVVGGATYVVQMSPAKGGSAKRTYELRVNFE